MQTPFLLGVNPVWHLEQMPVAVLQAPDIVEQ